MPTTLNNSEIRQRIDTHSNWNTANPVLGNGEFAISSDKNDFKIGDGTKNWQTSQYIIANNPTVTAAATAASNAATAASNAATAASNAYTLATQALAASGRKEPTVNNDPYRGHSGVAIKVDNTFMEKFRNYDFESLKGESDLTLSITATQRKYYENANEIRFHFMTVSSASKIVIPNGTRTVSEVDGNNKIMVVAEGDYASLNISDYTSITIPANYNVEVRFINTWLVKVIVNRL